MYSRYRMTEARLGTDRLPGSVHRPITRRRQRCCCLRDFRDVDYSSVIYSTCWSAARHSGDGKRGRRKQCLKTVLLLFLRTVRHFGVSSMSTAWGGVSVAVHLIVCVGCWTFCYTLPVRHLDVSHLWTLRYQDVSLPPWTFRHLSQSL